MAPRGLNQNARRNAFFLQQLLEDFETACVFGGFIDWRNSFWHKRERKRHGVDEFIMIKADDVRRDFFSVVDEQGGDVDFVHGLRLG